MDRSRVIALSVLASGCTILGGSDLTEGECRTLVDRTIEFHLPTYERLQDPARGQMRDELLRSEKGVAAIAGCRSSIRRAAYQCAMAARDPGDFEGCLSPGPYFGLASKW